MYNQIKRDLIAEVPYFYLVFILVIPFGVIGQELSQTNIG
jgi:hypothetical protein